MPEINPLAVLAAATANVVMGAMWYNAPFMFNRVWLANIGKTAAQVQADFSILKLLVAVIGALVIAVILAVFIAWAEADTLLKGALVGGLAAIGFSAATSGIKGAFEGRPLTLWLINAGHDIVTLVIMGALLGLWHPWI